MTTNMLKLVVVLCLVGILGCEHAGSVSSGSTVSYEHIFGAAQSKRPVGLCELVRIMDGGGGVYRVAAMKGQIEEDLAHPGFVDGFTYVDLELQEPWTPGAAPHAVARVPGGPVGNGITRSWPVELSVGEVLGVLFYKPRVENRNYYGLDSLGLFQLDRKHGADAQGYTNGQLFRGAATSLGDVGRQVAALHDAGGKCPFDVLPAAPPASGAPIPDGAPRPVILGRD